MADIVIVASAFGAAQVLEQGHHAYVPLAASVGAAGFEVRRELLPAGLDGTVSADVLAALGRLMAAHGLWAVYSTPATLYSHDGALDAVAIRGALVEAQTLGARIVKFQLGGFAGDASPEALAQLLQGWRARVLVENGQQAVGGSLSQFRGLFGALEATGAADMLGMTFDVGNWEWAGETPLACAQALAPYVEYIHCKSVAGEGARRFAVAPAGNDARFAAVLAALPGDVPRGIEFPFNAVDPAADAHQHVMWLKAA
ncbi:xylose isomerase [Ralstonia pickettii]|uniref:Xylose isomerase n=1 Tax=Ralstonia pickettii TaxID=329 RepID=A0A2N4TX31_RALPI|nr:TIM barrel protein [Ralstonia pickettii]PLC44249.1 xylose isomerase [Ralstonia pickettii]